MNKTIGQVAYEAYAATTDWKSAISGVSNGLMPNSSPPVAGAVPDLPAGWG